MPVVAGSTSTPINPLTGVEDVGTISASWTDPAGGVWPLSVTSDALGWFTTGGIAGWGSRPYEITSDPLPRGGDEVRFIRAQAGRITWPLYIWGETHVQFVQRYRDLRRAFLMTAHRRLPGILKVAYPDGSARTIEAYYEDGFAGEAGENWLFANPVLTLFCPDGFWKDVVPVVVPRTYPATPVPFLAPYPTVSDGRVLGNTTIVNTGDVDAWPDWVITGPMTAIVATNHTTGLTFTLTTTLTGGQQVTVTTQRSTVRGPGGANLVSGLNWPTAYLWPLAAGSNSVEFALAGSGAGSSVELSFYPRYEGV